MADKQVTPFQLTDQFTMENFNQRIEETNTALANKLDKSGDTMTGELNISKDNVGTLRMWGNKYGAYFASDKVGVSQYQLYLNRKADPTIESNINNALYLAVSNDGIGWHEVYQILHTGNANNLGYRKIVKLWENASPDSTFAGQTISLDLSQLQMVGIEVKQDSMLWLCIDGTEHEAVGNWGSSFYRYRVYTATSSGIVVGNGYQGSFGQAGSVNNGVLAPLKIYGII